MVLEVHGIENASETFCFSACFLKGFVVPQEVPSTGLFVPGPGKVRHSLEFHVMFTVPKTIRHIDFS